MRFGAASRLGSIALAILAMHALAEIGAPTRLARAQGQGFFQSSPGDLSQEHKSLDTPAKCNDCHVNGTKRLSNAKCLACHEHARSASADQRGQGLSREREGSRAKVRGVPRGARGSELQHHGVADDARRPERLRPQPCRLAPARESTRCCRARGATETATNSAGGFFWASPGCAGAVTKRISRTASTAATTCAASGATTRRRGTRKSGRWRSTTTRSPTPSFRWRARTSWWRAPSATPTIASTSGCEARATAATATSPRTRGTCSIAFDAAGVTRRAIARSSSSASITRPARVSGWPASTRRSAATSATPRRGANANRSVRVRRVTRATPSTAAGSASSAIRRAATSATPRGAFAAKRSSITTSAPASSCTGRTRRSAASAATAEGRGDSRTFGTRFRAASSA